MAQVHTYINTQIGTITNSTYGNTIRTAICNALRFLDELITNSGNTNTFVVLTQEEYDNLVDADKTATAYFIVEATSSS